MDEYSIVIQEFFQKRVEIWLETVGHGVFDIKHYWLRYEFAPSRGQIHAHLLAICGDYSFNVAMHRLKGNKEAQATFLQSWSKKAYSYTAEVEQNFDELSIDKEDSPCAERFSDVTDLTVDGQRILKFCQSHSCSAYCLKCSKSKKRKRSEKRVCRAGAGEEKTPGVGDTPGFVLRSEPVIVSDPRGYNRIELSRNHKRVVQSSLDLCQSWRGNCDFQILLYECDPFSPDPSEIARVTDYVVAYACKGNSTLSEEKRQMKQLVLR